MAAGIIFAGVGGVTFIVMVLLAMYLNGYFESGNDKITPLKLTTSSSIDTRRRYGNYGRYSARMR